MTKALESEPYGDTTTRVLHEALAKLRSSALGAPTVEALAVLVENGRFNDVEAILGALEGAARNED